MSDVVPFRSQSQIERAARLARFIQQGRETYAFGSSVNWDDVCWDISEKIDLKGHGRKRFTIWWTNLASSDVRAKTPLAPEYIDFARACLSYRQAVRPVQDPSRELFCHRVVEAALREVGGRADPADIDHHILTRAAALAKSHFGEKIAYQVGQKLEGLAEFLTTEQLTRSPLAAWRNPNRKPVDNRSRIGEEFERKRAAVLPGDDELEAVGKAFYLSSTPHLQTYSSIAALLCAAPDRFSELFRLPVACRTEVSNSRGGSSLCLRWWPSKGAEPMIKPVIASFAPIVNEAIDRLVKHGAPAREMARWYEDHPTSLFLPAGMEDLRGQVSLAVADIQHLLAYATAASAVRWCRVRGVSLYLDAACRTLAPEGNNKKWFVRFDEFERAVVAMLPRHFPMLDRRTGLRYSEALCVVPTGISRAECAPSRCMFEPLTIGRFNRAMGERANGGSIFELLDLRRDNGEPIRLTSKMFRHFLNTEAQRGGLGDLLTAVWSGRKDIRQNAAYDHVTASELVEQLREHSSGDDDLISIGGPVATRHEPVSREAYLADPKSRGRMAHLTDFGVCLHDFSMDPCNWFLSCMTCDEHACVKRSAARGDELRHELSLQQQMLAGAQAADEQGDDGADRWVQSKSLEIKRTEALLSVYDDPNVPYGSYFRFDQGRATIAVIKTAEIGPAAPPARLV